MRILFLMNDEGSPPGVLLEETNASGHEASVLVPYKKISHDPRLPGEVPGSSDGFDGLVVLGGAMSILDEADHPFIDQTRSLLRAFDVARKPVMGVCFGAQLLADAHGGRVKPLGHTEWGFLPQTWLPATTEDILLKDSPEGLPLMQWHGDTFDLPDVALPLSTRPDCPGQAFRIGDFNWGLQFHLELDQPTLLNWAALHAAELKEEPAPHVRQMEKDIGTFHEAQASFARHVMSRWLAVCKSAKTGR